MIFTLVRTRLSIVLELSTGLVATALIFLVLLLPSSSWSQPAPGSMDVHWNEGASNCSTSVAPPLQVHPYNLQTFILRENLCVTFEAPFMYLLIGSSEALLIDTDDIADPNRVPLAKTVMGLLPGPELLSSRPTKTCCLRFHSAALFTV